MSTEKQDTLPALYGEKLPEIPEETLDKLLKTAEQNTLLASVKKGGGFEVKGAWFSSLTGVICIIYAYLIKWVDREPHRLPYIEDELDWPEGYKSGADVTIFTLDRVKVKFSLSMSSFRYELCDYIRLLNGQGLKPTEVVTTFTTRQVNGQFGEYTVVVPELAQDESDIVNLSAPQAIEEPDPSAGSAADEIPF